MVAKRRDNIVVTEKHSRFRAIHIDCKRLIRWKQEHLNRFSLAVAFLMAPICSGPLVATAWTNSEHHAPAWAVVAPWAGAFLILGVPALVAVPLRFYRSMMVRLRGLAYGVLLCVVGVLIAVLIVGFSGYPEERMGSGAQLVILAGMLAVPLALVAAAVLFAKSWVGADSNKRRMSTFGSEHNRRSVHGRTLCWAARIVPMYIGLWLAVGVMIAYVDAILPHDYEVEIQDPMAGLILLVPLVLAAIAWRWHLIGGISIILATAISFLYFVLRPPYEAGTFYFVYFPWAMVFLGGGILNLIAWGRERRR
jgi:hypothetical protein